MSFLWERSPTPMMPTTISLRDAAEDSYAGITLSATDRDGSAVVAYALADSNGGIFAVDGDSGRVILRGSLDYELSTQHTIIGRAMSDDGSSSTAAFTVNVIDVNDLPLGEVTDSDQATDNTLPEDAGTGDYAGITLSATDGDGSAVVTYALSDSNGGIFAVGEDSGRVTLQGSLDYEQSTRHTIIAQARSSDGSDPSTAAFTIAVANINEIALRDSDDRSNAVVASTGAAVSGMTLEAAHADGARIMEWRLPDDSLFELTRDNDSSTQGLRIKADAENLRLPHKHHHYDKRHRPH